MTNSSGPMTQPQSSQGAEPPSYYTLSDVIRYLRLRAVHNETNPTLTIPFSIFKAYEIHQHDPERLEKEFLSHKSKISLDLGAEVVNDTTTVTSHDDGSPTKTTEQAKELRRHLASMLASDVAIAGLPDALRKRLGWTLISRLQTSRATLRGRADAQHPCDGSSGDTEVKRGIRTVAQGPLSLLPAVREGLLWLCITHLAPRYSSGAPPTDCNGISDNKNTLVIFPRSTTATDQPVDIPGIRLTFQNCNRCDIEPVNRVSKPGKLYSFKQSVTREGGYRERDWEKYDTGLAVWYEDSPDDDEEVRPRPADESKVANNAPRTAPLPKGVTLRKGRPGSS